MRRLINAHYSTKLRVSSDYDHKGMTWKCVCDVSYNNKLRKTKYNLVHIWYNLPKSSESNVHGTLYGPWKLISDADIRLYFVGLILIHRLI